MKKHSGAILLISGPSGCGKSSMLSDLFVKLDNYYFSISTTTRTKRDNEVEGVDYFFTSKNEFEKNIKANHFLEYAMVHQEYYGTSLVPIEEALSKNKLVILDIDVQGFFIASKLFSKYITSVMTTTPTKKILENRLRGRNTNDNIEERLKNSKQELSQLSKYDYIIINEDLQQARQELFNIAQTCLLKTPLYDNSSFLKHWDNG